MYWKAWKIAIYLFYISGYEKKNCIPPLVIMFIFYPSQSYIMSLFVLDLKMDDPLVLWSSEVINFLYLKHII